MKVRHRTHCALVLVLLFCTAAAWGQTPEGKPPGSSRRQQSDPRLKTPVSLSADSIYLGELLEKLSAQTGVALSMDNNDRLSGIRIICDLKQIPLNDVMDTLSSLLGYKSGSWEWKAEAGQSALRYLFRPTLAARQVPEHLREAMQERFERQAAAMVQTAFLSPEARQAHIDELASLMNPGQPESVKAFLQASLTDESVWAGLRLFGTLLSPEQRLRLLREGGTINIPLQDLSFDIRREVTTLEARDAVGNEDPTRRQPPVERIRFEGIRYKNGAVRSLTALMVGLGRGNDGISLHGCLGISPYQLASAVYADWLLPGDLPTQESETRPIIAPPDLKLDPVWQKTSSQGQRLAEVAAVEKVSLMAVLPAEGGFEMPSAFGQTARQYFELLWQVPRLMHKWRDGVLLVHYPEWFYGDDTLVPYALVKRLRAASLRQDGLLTLEDIAAPVLTLNAAQLGLLTAEFPFTGTRIVTRGLPPQPMTSLCAFYRRYPAAWSEQGVPLDLKLQAYLQDAKLWPTRWEEQERATAVRIADVPDRWAADVRHTYTLQLRTTKRAWIDIAKFATVRIPSSPRP